MWNSYRIKPGVGRERRTSWAKGCAGLLGLVFLSHLGRGLQ